jgi:hypothetical protein
MKLEQTSVKSSESIEYPDEHDRRPLYAIYLDPWWTSAAFPVNIFNSQQTLTSCLMITTSRVVKVRGIIIIPLPSLSALPQTYAVTVNVTYRLLSVKLKQT